jgi:hypothetical protein
VSTQSVDFARNAPVSRASRAWPQWIIPLVSNPYLIAISQDPLRCMALCAANIVTVPLAAVRPVTCTLDRSYIFVLLLLTLSLWLVCSPLFLSRCSLQGHRLWSDGVNGSNTNASAVFVPPGKAAEVWVSPLADDSAALMLVNKGEQLIIVNASFALAGKAFSGCKNVSVFDVFGQRDLGFWNGTTFGLPVPPHGAEIMKVACVGSVVHEE